jgi:hypothetical protein
MEKIIKILGGMAFGAVSTAFQAVYPLVCLAFLFVIADCISAWRLSRRVHKKQCNDGAKGSCGKFKSSKMAATVFSLILVIPSGLMLAHWTSLYVLTIDIPLSKIFAGVVIFWQLWSILENESSCSNANWAKVLQKIMVDKTSRHFDVDLSELKKGEKEDV